MAENEGLEFQELLIDTSRMKKTLDLSFNFSPPQENFKQLFLPVPANIVIDTTKKLIQSNIYDTIEMFTNYNFEKYTGTTYVTVKTGVVGGLAIGKDIFSKLKELDK